MKFLIMMSCAFFLFSCASKKPLTSRGLPAEERRYYIIQNGYGISRNVKDSFLQGIPCKGMSKDLVFQMYGPADREIQRGNQWEYLDHKGEMVTSVIFEDNIAIEILGDPLGGAAPESSSEN